VLNHKKLEKNSILLLIFTVIAISIGGLVEIVPLFRLETTIEPVKGIRPYTPLELAGRIFTFEKVVTVVIASKSGH
jgi:cytochrome c oxidase cbb3-type subunit 2